MKPTHYQSWTSVGFTHPTKVARRRFWGSGTADSGPCGPGNDPLPSQVRADVEPVEDQIGGLDLPGVRAVQKPDAG